MLKAQQLRHKNSALSTSKKLTLPETNSSPPQNWPGPKKENTSSNHCFSRAFAVTFREGHVPPKKICNFSFIVQCWKNLSPFSRHSGENASRFNGESRRWDLTWSFVGIFFRGKSLNVGTGFRKPSLFLIMGKKTRFIPCNSQDPWFFSWSAEPKKKRVVYEVWGFTSWTILGETIISNSLWLPGRVSYIKTLNLWILEFVWSLTWAPKTQIVWESEVWGHQLQNHHGSVSSTWKNWRIRGVVKEIQELKSRWHSPYVLVYFWTLY